MKNLDTAGLRQVCATTRSEARPERRRAFKVVELRGENLLDSFALRYQVYCLERDFLDPDDYPDRLESDEFEWSSRHVGVFDSDSRMVGTVRLVQGGQGRLPMDDHCTYTIADSATVGEISRLAVPRNSAAASLGTISLQLYRGLYQLARSNGMTHLISAMEPSLERLVRRMHIPWEPIGPLVDYYGWVRPYILDLDVLAQQLRKHAPGTLELFRTPLDSERDTVGALAAAARRRRTMAVAIA